MAKLYDFLDNPSFVGGSADFIADVAASAIAERGRFTIALSGGGTPKPIYARLATADYRDCIAWEKVHIFFGDERCVAGDVHRAAHQRGAARGVSGGRRRQSPDAVERDARAVST